MACSQAIEDGHDQSGMLALPEHVQGATQTGRREIIGTQGGIDEQLVERPTATGALPDDALRLQLHHAVIGQRIPGPHANSHITHRDRGGSSVVLDLWSLDLLTLPVRAPLRANRPRIATAPYRLARYGGIVVDTDATIERILTTYDTITVVGASSRREKAAHSVPAHMQAHGWRIIPVNPHADEILGEAVYRTLAGVPEQIGLVDVFRPSGQTPDIARQAVAIGATALWLQLGIASQETRAIAADAGLLYVEDRCLLIERHRFDLDAPHPQ